MRRIMPRFLLPVVGPLVATIMWASPSFAAIQGTWSRTAPMELARAFFTGTVLRNGDVLVAGGFSFPSHNVEFKSAEIYHVGSATWSPVANMNEVRAAAVAVRLPSGRVLMVGGEDLNGPHNTAEIYDPRNNTWTETAPMLGYHDEDFVVKVLPQVGPDTRVLVAGGFDQTGTPSAEAEIYDVQQNTWTAAASMTDARGEFGWVTLRSSNLLVVGGVATDGTPLASAEIYHVDTGTWTTTGNLNLGRADEAVVRLADGRVLAAGGFAPVQGNPYVASAEIWDPNTGAWTPTGDMTSPREEVEHASLLLTDGKVLVTGGYQAPETPQSSSDLFNPATGTWSSAGTMSSNRAGHVAVLLKDKRALVAGGIYVEPTATPSADLYTE